VNPSDAVRRRLQADARRFAATDDHRLQAFAKGIRYALKAIDRSNAPVTPRRDPNLAEERRLQTVFGMIAKDLEAHMANSRTQETPMARRTKKHHGAPISSEYRVKASKPGRRKFTATMYQKREAVRRSHSFARLLGVGARCEVRTKEGGLVYQAHHKIVAGRSRFVVEEL
jgi:hypothetical protein